MPASHLRLEKEHRSMPQVPRPPREAPGVGGVDGQIRHPFQNIVSAVVRSRTDILARQGTAVVAEPPAELGSEMERGRESLTSKSRSRQSSGHSTNVGAVNMPSSNEQHPERCIGRDPNAWRLRWCDVVLAGLLQIWVCLPV